MLAIIYIIYHLSGLASANKFMSVQQLNGDLYIQQGLVKTRIWHAIRVMPGFANLRLMLLKDERTLYT